MMSAQVSVAKIRHYNLSQSVKKLTCAYSSYTLLILTTQLEGPSSTILPSLLPEDVISSGFSHSTQIKAAHWENERSHMEVEEKRSEHRWNRKGVRKRRRRWDDLATIKIIIKPRDNQARIRKGNEPAR
ncbi:hypothetical protein GOP47_0014351 [Adiantum capillus-veneris]|uniref:Uncharacterized protein n=1 Tax=Adiantum capillus-veneris TaxID=13818 RepID=A0A9D4UMF1_ADICA|nr:hypothetical protein GOP47_0014351 [Adiantum capillus-veneris]